MLPSLAYEQRGSSYVAALGSLDARTQMTVRVSLGVIEARDAELILGSGRIGEGWRPNGSADRATS